MTAIDVDDFGLFIANFEFFANLEFVILAQRADFDTAESLTSNIRVNSVNDRKFGVIKFWWVHLGRIFLFLFLFHDDNHNRHFIRLRIIILVRNATFKFVFTKLRDVQFKSTTRRLDLFAFNFAIGADQRKLHIIFVFVIGS